MRSTSPSDLNDEAEQEHSWNAVAAGCETWHEVFESGAGEVTRHLVEFARVRQGRRVVDLATGVGEPALAAATIVGSTGRVVAVDIAASMLDCARTRAAALQLSWVEFIHADVNALRLPEGVFDAALCRFGLMYFGQPIATLRRIRHLLVPGGRIALAVWGSPPRSPFASLVPRVLHRYVKDQALPDLFAFAEPARLRSALSSAGFAEVASVTLARTFQFASPGHFVRFEQMTNALLLRAVSALSIEQQNDIWHTLEESAEQYTAHDGTIHLPAECLCVTGRR